MDEVNRRSVLRALTAGSLGLMVQGTVPGLARADWTTRRRTGTTRMPGLPPGAAVVFVHAAWADGSNWQKVVPPLQQRGFRVLCAGIPLTTLSDDVDATVRWIERTTGPVVLVGHAYSGGVIGAVKHDRVKALVYISALAPAEGETVADVFYRDKPSPYQTKMVPDAQGWIYQPDDGFSRAVAPNVSEEEARVLFAVQRPLNLKCVQEKVPTPTWTTTPTWYLIAEEDRMINPVTQQFMSSRMKAHVKSVRTDHSPQLSAPQYVVNIVLEAAQATIVQQATG